MRSYRARPRRDIEAVNDTPLAGAPTAEYGRAATCPARGVDHRYNNAVLRRGGALRFVSSSYDHVCDRVRHCPRRGTGHSDIARTRAPWGERHLGDTSAGRSVCVFSDARFRPGVGWDGTSQGGRNGTFTGDPPAGQELWGMACQSTPRSTARNLDVSVDSAKEGGRRDDAQRRAPVVRNLTGAISDGGVLFRRSNRAAAVVY